MEVNLTTPIGARVKNLRERNGLSQHDLAVRSGVTVGRISLLELGKASNPTIDTLSKIAKGLGVEIKDLVDMETSEI